MSPGYGAIADDHSEADSVDELRDEILAKVEHFDLPFDADRGYRAKTLKIVSFQRPHMRAFHGSWMCFCAAWLIWFSAAPLLPVIASTIPMTTADIWKINMYSMIGTVPLRLVLGPLCDQYGGRGILTGIVGLCAALSGLTGALVGHSFLALLSVRSLVGCIGGALVPAQFWITSHFTNECSGVAMATAAGWGALGGALAQGLVGSVFYPTILEWTGDNTDLSWRLALVPPALLALVVTTFFYFCSDDCPLGDYESVQQAGLLARTSAVNSFRTGVANVNAWILFVQFGACLGIELTMESGLTAHLSNRFDLDLSDAASFATLFGLCNIVTRGFGGWCSDWMQRKYSLRGRLLIHMVLLMVEGVCILAFAHATSLSSTLVWLMIFASTGQMAMGTLFGLVPYLDRRSTGTIAGIVGAGGNVGGVALAHVFSQVASETTGFAVMASYCGISSLLTLLIVVKGYRCIVWGSEASEAGPQMLTVPRVK